MRLWAKESVPKDTDSAVGPRSVEECAAPHHGVWHPDGFTPVMVWRGSSCSADLLLGLPTTAFNPWALPPSKQQLVAERLTERLPSGSEALQWAMPLCVGEAGSLGVARDRGNLGVARQGAEWTEGRGLLLKAWGRLRY